MDKFPTDTEIERMDRGEENYGDPHWIICGWCKGSGLQYPGSEIICIQCSGKGEIMKDKIKVFYLIEEFPDSQDNELLKTKATSKGEAERIAKSFVKYGHGVSRAYTCKEIRETSWRGYLKSANLIKW